MAYRLLLVDDDIHSVECVRSGIDWETYHIADPRVAYNIRQAKEVLKVDPIDIMICDIEMPQGDGLELLAWINEQNLKVEVIFLTCHADFKYAQRALHMGSLEFLLKPVPFAELVEAVKKAQQIIDKERENTQYEQTYQLWKSHHPRLIESFWIDLLDQHISSDKDHIQEVVTQRAIPYSADMTFLPVLVSVQRWHKSLSNRDHKIMEYALRNALEEKFGEIIGINYQIVQQRGGSILVFLTESGENSFDFNQLKETCHTYIQSCNHYFYCDISCYIGLPARIYHMKEGVDSLYQRELNNVNSDNQVFLLDDKDRRGMKNSLSVVEKVMHYIDTRLNQDISREDIAQHVYLNADYLNRMFKKETALSLSEYILQQRIMKAKELLVKTEIPIGGIATSVGFSNLPYFSKMFKRETQMSPQDYRQYRQVVNH